MSLQLPVVNQTDEASTAAARWLPQPLNFQTFATLAQARSPQRQCESLYRRALGRASARNGLRQRQVSESHGMLFAEDGHVHDSGQRLHASLRILCGFARKARGTGVRRAGSGCRGFQAIGIAACRHHQCDRDDLPDGGAEHYYQCILAVREKDRSDRRGSDSGLCQQRFALDRVIEARPEVFNHNMETVPRLYRRVRGPKSDYAWTLDTQASQRIESLHQNQEWIDVRPR